MESHVATLYRVLLHSLIPAKLVCYTASVFIMSLHEFRYEDSVSFLTKVIEDIGEPLKDYSICYLLVMKSLLLNHDYNRCWTMLWEILKYFSIGDMNESFLKVKLQVCYLGCYLSICQHKFHLAEVLGYWYV